MFFPITLGPIILSVLRYAVTLQLRNQGGLRIWYPTLNSVKSRKDVLYYV